MAVRADGPGGQTPGQIVPPRGAVTPEYGNYTDSVRKAQTDAANAGETGAPPPAYNSDTRPVVVSKVQNYVPMSSTMKGQSGLTGNVTNVYDAKNLLSYWRSLRPSGDKTYDNVIGLMRATGYLGPRSNSLTGIEDAWTEVLTDGVSLFQENTGNTAQADVFDYLYGLLETNPVDQDGPGGNGPGGGGATPITARIDLTDPGTASSLVDNALVQYLGRRASEKETKAFRKALMQMEMANPATSDVAGSTAITGGDFNPQVFADEWAQGKEGAAEYQVATTFLDTFISSLSNPTEVVR